VATRALVSAAVAIAVAAPVSAADGSGRGPWLLAALPGMGRLTWSCDPRQHGYRIYGLRLDASTATATERVTVAVGAHTVVSRRLDPPGAMMLPRSAVPIRRITVAQATEPGTLRAVVTVDFRGTASLPSHCFAYLPPALTVHVMPR
jgi:hypothetical protein